VVQDSYTIVPIGTVQVDEQGFCLRIDPTFRPGLTGLEGYSFLQVLFWCHQVDDDGLRGQTVFDKPYSKGPDQVGVFATRSPVRPNPIALTPVAVLGIDHEAGVVRIPYIDAEPGSPIVDLKPYLGCLDRVRETATPAWCSHWPQWYEDSGDFDWAAEFGG
jgi:tRNA-Thr(GGU) m(6)t(6)A37 methyltransferase TsaA